MLLKQPLRMVCIKNTFNLKRNRATCFVLTNAGTSFYSVTLYVEVAANSMFGVGKDGLISPPDPARQFPLLSAEIVVVDKDVYDLIMDLTVLYDMSKVCVYVCIRGT